MKCEYDSSYRDVLKGVLQVFFCYTMYITNNAVSKLNPANACDYYFDHAVPIVSYAAK